MQDLLTRKEAAQMLRVKPDTVRKWHNTHKVQAIGYVNGRPRYSKEELEKLIKPKQA